MMAGSKQIEDERSSLKEPVRVPPVRVAGSRPSLRVRIRGDRYEPSSRLKRAKSFTLKFLSFGSSLFYELTPTSSPASLLRVKVAPLDVSCTYAQLHKQNNTMNHGIR